MKKLLSILLLVPLLCISQEYNKWSLEPTYELTKVRDITSVQHGSYNFGIRKMFNTKFGARLNYSYTESIENYHSGYLQGIANIGRILEFESFTNDYTILLGIGGHYSYFDTPKNSAILHRDSNFHLTGTIDNLVRITDKFVIKASLNVITGVNNRPFNNNSTETTSIINFGLGGVFYLGNKKKHADWYINKRERDTVIIKESIVNAPVYNMYSNCDCSPREIVMFDNDSYMLDKLARYVISKIERYMKINLDTKVYIHASSSNTTLTTTEQYDMDLSISRAAVIKDALISLGIPSERIITKPQGRNTTISLENRDYATKAELIVK